MQIRKFAISGLSNNLATALEKRLSRRSAGRDSNNRRSTLGKTTNIITGELVNLTDLETIKQRGEYLRIENTRKRLSVEDFDKRIEKDSWKLLTLITDQSSSQEGLEFLSDGIANVPDLTMTFESNRSFLIYSVLKADIKLILKLLELKPELLNQPDCLGRTPVHYAVLLKKFKVLSLLIEHGADFHARDVNGQTPLHFAAQKLSSEIYLFLKFKGASGLEEDNFGLRPIDYIENEDEFNEIQAMELGSPRKLTSRRSTEFYLNFTQSFGDLSLTRKVSSTFSNPGKREFNLRRKYFLRLGLVDYRKQSEYLSDGYVERYEQSVSDEISMDDEKSGHDLTEENKPENFGENGVEECPPHSVPELRHSIPVYNVHDMVTSCLSFQAKKKLTKVIHKDVEVQGMIGRGNFGKIYGVLVKNEGSLYAMKTFNKKEFLLTNMARFLFSEKRIMANFDHPFIVKMHYAFQNHSNLFILMDYCEKGDLGNQVMRLSNLQLKILTCELVLAIKALHDQGIIHRDLKPSNVFIGGDGHIKIGDFGLSKENIKRGSLHYTFCGSVAYLPPEVINKEGHNKTIDWYLLGEILYEMVTGFPPYYGQSKDELYQNIRFKDIDMKDLQISDSLKDLIARLVDRNMANRLGAQHGASEIMGHRYFVGIDWQKVYEKKYALFDPSAIHSYKLKQSLSDCPFNDIPDDSLHLPHWSFAR